MTVWGVVASVPVWQVVGGDWDKDALPLGWVTFSGEEAQALMATGGITHLLVEARADLLHESLIHAADSANLILVALITGNGAEEVARRQGVSLRVRQPDDLHQLLRPHQITQHPSSDFAVVGLTIAVWGPTGAPGRTTVASSLASVIAGRGLGVLLLDADSRSGAIAPALGLLDEVPGFIASCRLASRGQLTPEDLQRLSYRYDQAQVSVDVLTGVTSGRLYPEVTTDSISSVLAMAATLWEVVIVDTGSDIASSGREASATEVVASTCLRISDEAVALCQATPVGVARFARVIDDARNLRAGKPLPVVLNGVDQSRRSLSDEATLREALRRFAGVDTVMVIARDSGGCRQAEMLGVSVADCVPGSPFVAGLKALAGAWVEDAMARRRRHGVAGVDENQATRASPRLRNGGRLERWRILSKRMFALR
jgi:MinD-like ATPase involved in chromosome partitioning or flagellar assembly